MKSTINYDIDTISALLAGMICAAVFNPFDRAMFLASCNNSAVLTHENFTRPFHGYGQAVLQRAFVYLFLQAKLERNLKPLIHDYLKNDHEEKL